MIAAVVGALWLAFAGPLDGPAVARLVGGRNDTTWTVRHYPAAHGGGTVVAQEHWRGIAVAGARVAVRLGPDGGVRGIVGRRMAAALSMPEAIPSAAPDRSLRWYVEGGSVRLARVQPGALRREHGAVQRDLELRSIPDGQLLARRSAIDDATLWVSGWRENPLTTPTPIEWELEVVDAVPLVLEDDVARVLQCDLVGDACAAEIFPTADGPEAFLLPPPPLSDEEAHRDPHDPWVGPQVLQYLARIEAAFQGWGWDPFVWDVLDCTWQGVPADECKLWVWVNVRLAGDDGPIPYDGAHNDIAAGIHLGQGELGDVGFDLQLVAHEFTHHVTRGFGEPDPTDFEPDGAFWRNDRGAISEGTADLFARLVGESDALFGYFREVCGLYPGAQRRDVSIPWRCPDHVVGEVHMDGRIWASAWHDVHLALQERGLAGPDDLPRALLAALPAIRQLPAEDPAQFEAATAIVLDELALALGDHAATFAGGIAEERGLSACDRVVDLRTDPSVNGTFDPKDPSTSRFMMLRSHGTGTDPGLVEDHPFAPPLQHVVTLAPDEDRVVVRFVPDRWHRTRRGDEPREQEGLAVAALVRGGADPVPFRRDPETERVDHDADRRVLARPDPDDPTRRQIVIDELDPGGTYVIALVSLTPLDGDRLLLDELAWTIDSGAAPAFADPGCGCAGTGRAVGVPWPGVLLLWRRQSRRASSSRSSRSSSR